MNAKRAFKTFLFFAIAIGSIAASPPLPKADIATPPQWTITISNLNPSIPYYFAATLARGAGSSNQVESRWSTEVSGRFTNGIAALAWNDNGDPSINGSFIYYGIFPGTYSSKALVILPPVLTNVAVGVWSKCSTNGIDWFDRLLYNVTNPPGSMLLFKGPLWTTKTNFN